MDAGKRREAASFQRASGKGHPGSRTGHPVSRGGAALRYKVYQAFALVRRVVSSAFARWAPRRTLGELGEQQAARFLKRAGLRIVELRRRSQFGEIDIVAVEDRTVVFVEVKTRRTASQGRPGEAVDRRRRQRLVRAASAYLKAHRLGHNACRFDVVEVVWPIDEKPQIAHYRAAFAAEGAFHLGR
ncbi:MAG: YraN family protein [Planctomycetales bacterium]|nr:YraN family protein [Planctomycetales bacterium]